MLENTDKKSLVAESFVVFIMTINSWSKIKVLRFLGTLLGRALSLGCLSRNIVESSFFSLSLLLFSLF